MTQRERVCLALPGAAANIGVLAGAVEVMSAAFDFVAVGGTSAGALVALALAHGLAPSEIIALLGSMITRKDLLDKGWPFDDSPGLFRGKVIERLLRDVFGDVVMGDLGIPCRVTGWDSWTAHPFVVDSWADASLPVWRAARVAMSMEAFFDLVRLYEDNARLCGDGGMMVNVPHGIWDDRDEPTIGVRLSGQTSTFTIEDLLGAKRRLQTGDVERVTTWGGLMKALPRAALNASSAAWPSRKTGDGFRELVLPCDGGALDFGMTSTEWQRRVNQGRLGARAGMHR